ncbi:hypothetical protein NXS19_005856 [Fusarium pseudograminearum]|nr:hypothetical protein NXS19_005856 [Fusarium pseudograminearum]
MYYHRLKVFITSVIAEFQDYALLSTYPVDSSFVNTLINQHNRVVLSPAVVLGVAPTKRRINVEHSTRPPNSIITTHILPKHRRHVL